MVLKGTTRLQCFSKGSENIQQSCCAVFNTEFTVYNFCLGNGMHKWTIQKRYSDFDALDKELQNRFSKKMLKVDRLPAKAIFGSMSPSRISHRQKCLDQYLKVLFLRCYLTRCCGSASPRRFLPMILAHFFVHHLHFAYYDFEQALLKEPELLASAELYEFLEIPLEAAISDDEVDASKKSDKSRSVSRCVFSPMHSHESSGADRNTSVRGSDQG